MNPREIPLPYDQAVEEAVVASVLVDDEALSRIEGIAGPEDFFGEAAYDAFVACRALWQRGEAVNQLTVAHELGQTGKLRDDSLPWLSRLTEALPTPVGVEHYAASVHRDACWRALIQAGQEIVRVAYQAGADFAAGMGQAQALLEAVTRRDGEDGAAREMAAQLDRFWEQPGAEARGTRVVRSGYPELDAIVGGFHAGALVTVAAKTAVGKSAFVLNVVRNAAIGQGMRALVFSLEMSADEWTLRLLAHESGIDSKRLRLGTLSEHDERQVMAATAALWEAPIAIDDRAAMTVDQMRASCRRARTSRPVDLVVVDYMQLAQASRRHENRVQEVTEVSRGLKRLAAEEGVPVVAAAQLSRQADYRKGPDSVPRLSDLRESGSIEQDSDVVLFLHKPGDARDGLVQVIVAKNRGGPVGKTTLRLHPQTSRFEPLSPADEEAEVPSWAR